LHWELNKFEAVIESCDLSGGQRTTILSDPKLVRASFGSPWLYDGRVIFPLAEPPPNDTDANLWEIKVDTRSSRPIGEPRRLTTWAGFTFHDFSATADSRRMTFLKVSYQSDAYVGELEAGNTRLKTPRRVTLDERQDRPTAWTPDSKALIFTSDRNGTSDVFKQDINAIGAEVVVGGPENETNPRLSPDGSWVIYSASPRGIGPVPDQKLMKAPLRGGPPQLLASVRGLIGTRCPLGAPAAPCIVIQRDEKQQIVFSALDLEKGSLREVAKYSGVSGNIDVSPDGKRIALALPDHTKGVIKILSLVGEPEREITVEGWPALNSMDWSADGKGFFISSRAQPTEATLLYVTLEGKAHVLWRQRGNYNLWGVPSPNGRYLAIRGATTDSNAWMIESF